MWKLLVLLLAGVLVTACGGSGQSGWSADTHRKWSILDNSPYGQTFVEQGQQDIAGHQGTFKVVLPVGNESRRGYTIIKLVKADCAKQALLTVASGTFGPDGDSFGALPELGWQPVKAKTSAESIFNYLCRDASHHQG